MNDLERVRCYGDPQSTSRGPIMSVLVIHLYLAKARAFKTVVEWFSVDPERHVTDRLGNPSRGEGGGRDEQRHMANLLTDQRAEMGRDNLRHGRVDLDSQVDKHVRRQLAPI